MKGAAVKGAAVKGAAAMGAAVKGAAVKRSAAKGVAAKGGRRRMGRRADGAAGGWGGGEGIGGVKGRVYRPGCVGRVRSGRSRWLSPLVRPSSMDVMNSAWQPCATAEWTVAATGYGRALPQIDGREIDAAGRGARRGEAGRDRGVTRRDVGRDVARPGGTGA
ncbi:hypothetical protein GCM10012284_43820 [Mangrovihabitans endophyticus]|uniref:Uncharacterized protein n=1 Tax=Mangrovihabitans endophyticus TaxID=1751298 RepID=A0A8J3C186_9ACTN|nr:hypothetical protein GCM10012284_43820 [Mangrovihabitans endophyticus]